MADFLDQLLMHLSGAQNPDPVAGVAPPSADQVTNPMVASMISQQQQQPTQLSGVDVVAKPRPKTPDLAPPDLLVPLINRDAPSPYSSPSFTPSTPAPNAQPLNYDNSADLAGVRSAVQAEQPGGTGLWGAMGQGVQHGTLRNLLGAIGDTFLTHSGQKPINEERLESQQMGSAMAGYQNNPEAAIERLANSGAPGAPEMAMKLIEQQQMLKMRQTQMDQLAWQRQQTANYQKDRAIQGMAPTVAGWAQSPNIKTSADYKAVWDRADAQAKRVDPSYDAGVFGYVDPSVWTPGSMQGVGMTSNAQQVSADKAAQRAQAGRDTDVSARARIVAAGVGNKLPTTGSIDADVKYRIEHNTATQADHDWWNAQIHGKKAVHMLHPAGGGPGPAPNGGGGGSYPTFTPQQAAQAAQNPANSGKKYIGSDGQLRVFH